MDIEKGIDCTYYVLLLCDLGRLFPFFGGSEKEELFSTSFTTDGSCNLQPSHRCKSSAVTERLSHNSS